MSKSSDCASLKSLDCAVKSIVASNSLFAASTASSRSLILSTFAFASRFSAMPEPSRRSRRLVQTLCRAHEVGQLIRVRCIPCNITRHYPAGDLAKLLGDIPFWDVERHMRCERCKRREFDIDILLPSASDGLKIRVRRLAGVRLVRQVIWRDDG
ncbi:hypothetical protein [Mesorhizobium sp. LNHC209A00]|uniref:hypothetical protein n=1 Tax=Mesorhizobium TaxID=68287 RepID=UPI001FDA803F|nr:hypothetical protein [Mesorhizobium sp. LNHC209A00]